jgi:hypothetical protein
VNYRLAVDSESMEFMFALRLADRTRLVNWIDRLKNAPFTKGPATVTDPTGREIQVSVVSSFRIHYWPDHAVKTVHVTKIELND